MNLRTNFVVFVFCCNHDQQNYRLAVVYYAPSPKLLTKLSHGLSVHKCSVKYDVSTKHVEGRKNQHGMNHFELSAEQLLNDVERKDDV